MKDWLISLGKTLLAQKLPIIGASITPALASVLIYLRAEIAPYLADPTGWLALKAIALSVALLPLPIVAYFWFLPKFRHHPNRGGVYENIKTGAYFCASCLIKDKLESPLVTQPNGWRCMVRNCNAFFHNPDHKQSIEKQSFAKHFNNRI
ncbi:MAG: hypothetical protein ACK4WS_03265 [Burkholderiales bacterium]|jgi:hypothetical protein